MMSKIRSLGQSLRQYVTHMPKSQLMIISQWLVIVSLAVTLAVQYRSHQRPSLPVAPPEKAAKRPKKPSKNMPQNPPPAVSFFKSKMEQVSNVFSTPFWSRFVPSKDGNSKSGSSKPAPQTELSGKVFQNPSQSPSPKELPKDSAQSVTEETPRAPTVSSSSATAAADKKHNASVCESIEYRGTDPKNTQISAEDWKLVMDAFHDSKAALITWLDAHKKSFKANDLVLMKKQIETLMVVRPPSTEEPDLTWRGIALLLRYSDGRAVISMGSGFIKLLKSDARRAKFELTRVVAQAWAPCELKRISAREDIWDPTLACLEVTEDRACKPGSNSESGWAVSSTIAAMISPAKCTLPVFTNQKTLECLKKDELWKGVQR